MKTFRKSLPRNTKQRQELTLKKLEKTVKQRIKTTWEDKVPSPSQDQPRWIYVTEEKNYISKTGRKAIGMALRF